MNWLQRGESEEVVYGNDWKIVSFLIDSVGSI